MILKARGAWMLATTLCSSMYLVIKAQSYGVIHCFSIAKSRRFSTAFGFRM